MDPKYRKFTRTPKEISLKQWLKPSKEMKSSGVGWKMRLPGYDEAGKGNGEFQHRYELEIPRNNGVGAGLLPEQLTDIDNALRFIPDHPLKFPRPPRGKKQLPRRPRQNPPEPEKSKSANSGS